MILGIGTDLTSIDRIKMTINKYGSKFLNRVFSKSEQEKAYSKKNNVASFAKRWAVGTCVNRDKNVWNNPSSTIDLSLFN